MRIACLLIPHLRAEIELQRQPALKDRPVVIIDRDARSPLVVDASPAAGRVKPGMTLEQALSMHADPAVLKADERACEALFRQILAALQEVSDRVEGGDPGRAWLRLDGLEQIFGGERRLLDEVLPGCVPDYLTTRIGVANAKFPALVAARLARDGGAVTVPADVRGFLAPHSIDHLPLEAETGTAMHRFGLHTMGSVAAMQKHHVVDQFGPAGRRAWELCRGLDDSPWCPTTPRRPSSSTPGCPSAPIPCSTCWPRWRRFSCGPGPGRKCRDDRPVVRSWSASSAMRPRGRRPSTSAAARRAASAPPSSCAAGWSWTTPRPRWRS